MKIENNYQDVYMKKDKHGTFVMDKEKTETEFYKEISKKMMDSLTPKERNYLVKNPDKIDEILKEVIPK